MFRMGPGEILLIVIAVLIIFGPKRLPELGRGIGQFFKNFKKGITGENPDEKGEIDKK